MAVFGAMKRTRTFEDANETTKSSMKKNERSSIAWKRTSWTINDMKISHL